jgi:hypothetical protein
MQGASGRRRIGRASSHADRLRAVIRGLVATLAALVVCAFVLAACGGDDGAATFEEEGFPFTFEYPGDFEVTEDISFDQSLGGSSDEDVSLSLDEDNGIILQRFTLELEVDESNLRLAKREFDALFSQGGVEASPGQTGETAGFPSLEYESIALTVPEDGESRMVILFEGDQEYLLNCQSTPDEREEVDAACEQMLETLARTN